MKNKLNITFSILILAILAFGQAAFAQQGGLDTTFGTNNTGIYQDALPAPANPQADGDLDTAFNPQIIGSSVMSLAVQPNGKIIIFGQFVSVNGTTRNRLARLDADGTLDATFDNGAGVDGIPFVVVLQTDGKILIGGNFNNVNGTARKNIARLNSDGSVDTTFNPGTGATGGIQPDVETIAVQTDGQILIGGAFTTFNGTARMGIARLNSNGSLDTGFVPAALNQGGVSSIVVQPDGKVIVGGFFTTVNGNIQRRLARFNANGSNDPTFLIGNGLSDFILFNGIARQTDGKILLGGEFTSVNGTPRNRVARLNENGTVDATFNPGTGANATVGQIGLQPDGKILIGGSFTAYNGTARNHLARLETNGTLDTSFNIGTGFDSGVTTFALQNDGKLVVSGPFSAYNGTARRLLARILATTAAPNRTRFDFDGDGRADLSVFRPSNSNWYYLRSSNSSFNGVPFGAENDKLAPADYDGDGRADFAVYRSGVWYILQSTNNQFRAVSFGSSEDLPRPGDFDGDGRADIAVFRPSIGTWFYQRSSDGAFRGVQFGQLGDVPMIVDFDADGKADIAVFRPTNGVWYWLRSSDSQFQSAQFGTTDDIPLSGDFNGDGKSDLAVYRRSNGFWYVARPTGTPAQNFEATQFGLSTDLPVAADYDGDGKTDIAVFRAGTWYLNRSTAGLTGVAFGASADNPVPAVYQQP